MTLLLNEPPDDAFGRGATYARAGQRPASVADRARGVLAKTPPGFLIEQQGRLAADLIDGETRGRMADLYSATDRAQTLIDNTFSREDARHEAFQRRIDEIHRQTGVQLDNPIRAEKMAAVTGWGLLPSPGQSGVDAAADEAMRTFRASLADLQTKFPDHAALFDPDFEAETNALVAGAQSGLEAAEAGGEDLSTVSRLAASLAGGFRGSLRDPMQVATLFVGGAPARGASVMARIGETMLTEAVLNAGVEALIQKRAQAWRMANGLEAGILPALKQIGLAGLFGGTLGGVLAGAREAARAVGITGKAEVDAIERVATGQGSARDLETASGALERPLDGDDAKAGAVAAGEAEHASAAFGERPQGITAGEAAELERAGIRHVEHDGPVPAGPVIKATRDPAEARVLSEADPATARLEIAGRPVTFERFEPETLGTDAATYQYKGGGDVAGVTKRLADVKRWDPTASGKVIVHEREDGARFVADGHQRLGLARRLMDEGDDGVRLDGYLFREADGWSAQDVRAFAAKKNMQEGSGEAIDAARIMRERPDLIDDGLPMSGPMMKKAQGLARLDDDAWGLAVNGLVDENHAALVGELMPPELHGAAIRDLAKFGPETDRQARLLLEEIAASGVRHESQVDMFGSFDLSRTLIQERVKVLDSAVKILRSDKRLFQLLADRADVIEAAGNQLDSQGNRVRAVTAETIGGLIDRLARTRGPVSDALTEAARAYAEGAPASRAARGFIDDIQAALERDGIARLLSPPDPELKAPEALPEPATPEAAELAGDMPEPEPSAADLEEAGQVSLWDVLPDGTDGDGNAVYVTADELVARAERDLDHADLIDACEA